MTPVRTLQLHSIQAAFLTLVAFTSPLLEAEDPWGTAWVLLVELAYVLLLMRLVMTLALWIVESRG